MDIKSKKWKSIVSFTAFAVGFSLLTASALRLLEISLFEGYGGFSLKGNLNQDYQQTREFREYVESTLEEFLCMASGNMPGWYMSVDYGDGAQTDAITQGDTDAAVSVTEEKAASQEVTFEGGNWLSKDSGETVITSGYGYYEENGWNRGYISGEEGREQADRCHEYRKNDKNLLYVISYEGKTLYSNAEGVELKGADGKTPAGYNFLLYFDGEKVRIIKDGQETDVYGDGYYREDSAAWKVPGYHNFPAEGDIKKAVVVMAAAVEPLLYTSGSYGASSGQETGNQLYWIERETKRRSRITRESIVGIVAAAGFLLLYAALRKKKAQADRFIARGTGKIWFEVKLGFMLALSAGLVLFLSRSQMWQEWYYSWYQYGEGSVEYFIEILVRSAIDNPIIVAFWCWSLYVFVNDMRYRKKAWRHGICYKLETVLGSGDIRLPLGKKLVCGFIPVFAGGVLCQVIWTGWLLYSDYRGFMAHPRAIFLAMTALCAMLIAIEYFYMRRVKRLAGDIDLLTDRIEEIHDGDYEGKSTMPEDSCLAGTMEQLDEIRTGMEQAVDEKVKSERMKVELIANVSHDIKTPLTSIVSYVEILKQEEELPEHVKDYVRILEDKALRLKNMVQDVFEVSKAGSGQLPVKIEILDFGKLLRQTMADMQELIQAGQVVFKTEIPEEAVMIEADGQRLYRVFQNLIQNALQYSLEGSRVYITLKREADAAIASVKNTSRKELDRGVDYSERFTRGDESRTDGGSGLGLAIARSFTEACGGEFGLETIADLFVVTITFKIRKEDDDAKA